MPAEQSYDRMTAQQARVSNEFRSWCSKTECVSEVMAASSFVVDTISSEALPTQRAQLYQVVLVVSSVIDRAVLPDRVVVYALEKLLVSAAVVVPTTLDL